MNTDMILNNPVEQGHDGHQSILEKTYEILIVQHISRMNLDLYNWELWGLDVRGFREMYPNQKM